MHLHKNVKTMNANFKQNYLLQNYLLHLKWLIIAVF